MQEEHPPALDLDRYIRIIRQRRYLVLAVALTVLSVLTWGSFVWPKVYEASSTMMIDKSGIVNPLTPSGRSLGNEERLRHIRNTITSRSIVERVIKKLGLDASIKNDAQYDALIVKIQKRLTVSIGGLGSHPDPDLFTIAYRGRNPKNVMDIVDTLVKEFIVESASHQRREAIGTYDFIDEQLSVYKKKLSDSDREIREFRERHPEMIPQNENTIVGRIENFQTSQIETTIRLKELERKRENLKKQLSGEKELTTAYVSSDASPVSRLNHLNNELMLLLTKYTEDYPEVIKVRSEIQELQKQLSEPASARHRRTADAVGTEMKAINPVYRQIKEELSKTESEIDSMKARLSELAKQRDHERTLLGRMPKEQEEWAKLQRDRSAYQKVYDELIQKRESARVSKDLEDTDKTTRFRVVDPPIMPVLPVSPNRINLIVVGLFLGIAAGIGAAIGLEYFDHSFKVEEDVRRDLQLSVLASIPTIVTDEDVRAEAKLDRKVYLAAAAYLGVIGLVFVGELLYRYAGITFMHF